LQRDADPLISVHFPQQTLSVVKTAFSVFYIDTVVLSDAMDLGGIEWVLRYLQLGTFELSATVPDTLTGTFILRGFIADP